MCMFGTRMAVSSKSIACKNLRENFIKLGRDTNEKRLTVKLFEVNFSPEFSHSP